MVWHLIDLSHEHVNLSFQLKQVLLAKLFVCELVQVFELDIDGFSKRLYIHFEQVEVVVGEVDAVFRSKWLLTLQWIYLQLGVLFFKWQHQV